MLRLQTFDGLNVTHPDRAIGGAVVQPRRLALLAVLARAGERGVSRDRLLAMFWPDDDEERSRKALAQAVYALRRDLGAEGAITGTQELRLDPEVLGSDVADFARLLKEGRLEEAVALQAGPFLHGFHLAGAPAFERWADDERTALRHDLIRALDRLAAAADRAEGPAAALPHLKRLAGLDPLDAQVAVRYMRALEATGQRAAALSHARIYESLLAQELDLPPDREVVALAETLRAAPPPPSQSPPHEAATVPPPVEASSDDIGEVEVAPAPAHPEVSRGISVSRRRGWRVVALAAVGVLAIVAVLGWIGQGRKATPVAWAVTEVRRVTIAEGLELDPVLSPDGRFLAYAAGPEGQMRIHVRQVDAAGRDIVVSEGVSGDHRRPRWSPDGTLLLFQADRALWSVPALGGATRVVVPAPDDPQVEVRSPEWAPDGKQIAWVRGDELHISNPDGSAARPHLRGTSLHSPVWSPDGTMLAIAWGNLAFTFGATAADPGTIGLGNVAPALVVLLDLASGDTVHIGNPDHLTTSPTWLGPRDLGFVSNRSGSRDLYHLPIGRTIRDHADPIRLTTGMELHHAAAVPATGMLAYVEFRQALNLWMLPLRDGAVARDADATPLTTGQQSIEAMDISPDGAWIAYDALVGGSQDIYRMPLDRSSPPELVVSTPADAFHPRWSPDGTRLAFYTIRGGLRRAALVGARGGAVDTPWPDEPNTSDYAPTWHPDGLGLLLHRIRGTERQLFESRHTPTGEWSVPRQLTTQGGYRPKVSPDGRWIAYFSEREDLLLMDATEGEASRRVLVPAGAGGSLLAAEWGRLDGRLYVKRADPDGAVTFHVVELMTGQLRAVARLDDERRPSVRPEFATDGRRLIFTLATRAADVGVARLMPR